MELQAAKQAAVAKVIHPHGYWLEDLPDGELHDPAIEQALVKLCEGQKVVDMGCGRGWYVEALSRAGIAAFGVDGNPEVQKLGPRYICADLAESLVIVEGEAVAIGRETDIVLCLEVGEHMPAEYADQLLDNVCRNAEKRVVLSWAIPGQVGHGHVNCQSNEWVAEQMSRRGFVRNATIENELRTVATLPYFKNTLMVYDRAWPRQHETTSLEEQLVTDERPQFIHQPSDCGV
jgi:SAM-dependent methyltransferase